jgi:hypothetical protein
MILPVFLVVKEYDPELTQVFDSYRQSVFHGSTSTAGY